MIEILNNCPFCGGEAVILTCHDIGHDKIYYVKCSDCCTMSGTYVDKNDAVKMWNTRSPKDLGSSVCVKGFATWEKELSETFSEDMQKRFTALAPDVYCAMREACAVLEMLIVEDAYNPQSIMAVRQKIARILVATDGKKEGK